MVDSGTSGYVIENDGNSWHVGIGLHSSTVLTVGSSSDLYLYPCDQIIHLQLAYGRNTSAALTESGKAAVDV
jgi:hypothetical protein